MKKENHSRNVCVIADGNIDRSQTGAGVCAIIEVHYEKKQIGINEPVVIENIIGSEFTGRVAKTTKFGDYDAIIPEVEGKAYVAGKHQFIRDPYDPI